MAKLPWHDLVSKRSMPSLNLPSKKLDVNLYTSCYGVDPYSRATPNEMKKKPMPLLNATATTANMVYQVSLITLLLGTGLVLISAVALIWSSSIRQRDTDARLANLNDVTARANAEVAKAQAEVIAANRKVAEANRAASNAEKAITDVNPLPRSAITGRQVTVENCGLFITFVKTVSKGRVTIEAIVSNPEAIQFAKQISDMLKSAGYDTVESFGSATLLGEEPVGVQMKIRSMDEQPAYAGSLQRGLEFIGIDTSGALDASAGDAVIIFVGRKP
jgi:hypothetical protein